MAVTLKTGDETMKDYIKLARFKHCIKNIFILMPLFFGHRLFDLSADICCFFGFLAFTFLSSVIYIINDINDVENDRRHPKKRMRPIASGKISVKNGTIYACVLGVLAIVCAFFACRQNPFSALFLVVYFAINFLYSFGLKNYPIVDVAILASGFLLRVLFGASVVDIKVSSWLYLTVLSLSFYLGLGKRRNELKRQSDSARTVLKFYSYEFLDKMMYMFMAIALVFYSLWCADPLTVSATSHSGIVWTVPVIILILMRYSYIVEGDSDGDPAEVVLHDVPLIILGAFYAVLITLLLYVK